MRARGRAALTRRRALKLGLGALAQPIVAAPAIAGSRLLATPPTALKNDPFPLGVASGDPQPDGFVLWTRLAPDPLTEDSATPGGLAVRTGDIALQYEIAADPDMRRIVRRGLTLAEADFAYAVHLEVGGLAPGRPYWYRFMTDSAASAIGCARTAPAPGDGLDRLRFGVVCCSNYEQGYFSAYRHLAEETPDLVLFLGDYIYETADLSRPVVRHHSDGTVADSLLGYRNRYAQYRLDPDLRALHAAAPCLMIWDDHEVENDYAGRWSAVFEDPARFLARRAAAYQAFYEHMPVRPSLCRPQPGGMRIYDRFDYGDLVTFNMLDGRQYRSREACAAPPGNGGGHIVTAAQCPELIDPARSMLGAAQEEWLYDGLATSRSKWNIIGQNVLMAPLRDNRPGAEAHAWTDSWDGYPACRTRLLNHVAQSGVANPVVLSGDNHAFWNNDLKRDFTDPAAPTIATEFVCTSVTSYGPPYDLFSSWLPNNPHVRFFESRKRGYISAELTPERLTTRFQAISNAADRAATVDTLASFVIENGRKGAVAA